MYNLSLGGGAGGKNPRMEPSFVLFSLHLLGKALQRVHEESPPELRGRKRPVSSGRTAHCPVLVSDTGRQCAAPGSFSSCAGDCICSHSLIFSCLHQENAVAMESCETRICAMCGEAVQFL